MADVDFEVALAASVGLPPLIDARVSVSFAAIQAPLDKRVAVRTKGKLWDSQGAVTALNMLTLGDSLANREQAHFMYSLDRGMGGRGGGQVYNPAGNDFVNNGSAGNDMDQSTATGTVTAETNYAKWPVPYVRIASGGTLVFVSSGAAPTFTDIGVMAIKESGAGTLGLKVGGSEVATVAMAGASGVAYLTYTQAVAQATVQLTATGGDVLVAFVHKLDSTLPGVNNYSRMSVGGLALTSAILAQSNWQAALALLPTIDAVTLQMDDEFGTDAPTQSAFASLWTMIDTVAPLADKIIIGSTPRAVNDAGKAASDSWLRGQVANRPANYLFYGGYTPLGTYANIVAQGIQGDGTHLAPKAYAILGDDMFNKLGLNGQMGYHARPVNMRAAPSYLGAGTRIGASALAGGLQADLGFVDLGSGYVWRLSFNQKLEFANDAGAVAAQFSLNTGTYPNMLPANYDIGTVGATAKFAYEASGGKNFARFKDSSNASAFANVQIQGIRFTALTAAQATSELPASSFPGVAVYLSDGVNSLGAGNYLAGGGSTGDFRKILTASSSSGSATAGSATLPANPVGFLVVNINGTNVKIPYYAT